MADITFSALASVSALISPSMVTKAVCAKLIWLEPEVNPKLNTCQKTKTKRDIQARRMPIFQRRCDFCSLRCANARSLRVFRAQLSSTGLVTGVLTTAAL